MLTIASTLLSCLLGLVASAPRLQIDVIFQGLPMRSEIEASAMAEVASIWARYGVDIRVSCENDETRDGAIKLVVVLADDRAKDSAAVALGSTLFVDGVPRPTIFMHPKVIDGLVSSATVMGHIDRQLPRGFHDFIVGRVFGRALAHEIGHYLLRSPSHSGKGLMRALQFTPDLVGQDRELFALSADQVIRLDSLLTQINRADNSAEKVSGSRDFVGSERCTNTTSWTPGPAIPAVAPKQSANRDDHSKQRGLNRPRHDECGLRMTMP